MTQTQVGPVGKTDGEVLWLCATLILNYILQL